MKYRFIQMINNYNNNILKTTKITLLGPTIEIEFKELHFKLVEIQRK